MTVKSVISDSLHGQECLLPSVDDELPSMKVAPSESRYRGKEKRITVKDGVRFFEGYTDEEFKQYIMREEYSKFISARYQEEHPGTDNWQKKKLRS